MNLAKTDRSNRLYDIYHPLLTAYQQEIFELYYQEDLSLKEIAEMKQVSRNAIFTLLKRVQVALEDYEGKLKLYQKNIQLYDLLEKKDIPPALLQAIRNIIE